MTNAARVLLPEVRLLGPTQSAGSGHDVGGLEGSDLMDPHATLVEARKTMRDIGVSGRHVIIDTNYASLLFLT